MDPLARGRQSAYKSPPEVGMVNVAPYVVVVGIDYSLNSLHALDEALRLTSARAGELHVLHVEHEEILQSDAEAAMAHDVSLEKVRQRASDRIAELTKQGPLAIRRVIAHLRLGGAAEQIAQLAADLDADLVVVGSHGHRLLDRFLLGSVAERTNRLARCPVFTVRPKEHDATGRVPAIEPPCPDCVVRRRETNGKEIWCARHSEHHVRPHVVTYSADPYFAPETTAYESTPM
jgi:nucleotide-binding universal stress UspA family protein